MKKAILALLFIAGIAVSANAQQQQQAPPQDQPSAPVMGKTADDRAMHMTKVLGKKLNLTAKQEKRVDRIYLNQAMGLDSIRNYPSANKRADAQQKKSIKKNAQQEIMSVLTADQQQKFVQYEKMLKQKHNNRKNKGNEPAPASDDNGSDNQGQG